MREKIPKRVRCASLGDFTRLSEIIGELLFLYGAETEALSEAESLAPIAGPVQESQRPWSALLDQIEAERQEVGA